MHIYIIYTHYIYAHIYNIWTYIYVYLESSGQMFSYASVIFYTGIWIYMHEYIHTYMHEYIHTYMHEYIHTCYIFFGEMFSCVSFAYIYNICIYAHICTHIHVGIYAWIYTYMSDMSEPFCCVLGHSVCKKCREWWGVLMWFVNRGLCPTKAK